MAIGDAVTEQHFPFAYDRVFDALLGVLPSIGFAVQSEDRVIGRVTATAGTATASPSERMAVQVRRIDERSSLLIFHSNHDGENGNSAERIIAAMSANLQGPPRSLLMSSWP